FHSSLFSFYCYVAPRDLPSFPTRRSSDLAIIQLGTLGGLPVISREEGGDDVKSSWPLQAGLHTCYNGGDRGMRWREPEQISKSRDRKSTRLNSSHSQISYAVFCLKKKKKN